MLLRAARDLHLGLSLDAGLNVLFLSESTHNLSGYGKFQQRYLEPLTAKSEVNLDVVRHRTAEATC